jgi:hypothetical protein
LVQGMFGVTLDIAHFAVAQVHAYTAAAGTHVAGGGAYIGAGTAEYGLGGIVEWYGRHAVGTKWRTGRACELPLLHVRH